MTIALVVLGLLVAGAWATAGVIALRMAGVKTELGEEKVARGVAEDALKRTSASLADEKKRHDAIDADYEAKLQALEAKLVALDVPGSVRKELQDMFKGGGK